MQFRPNPGFRYPRRPLPISQPRFNMSWLWTRGPIDFPSWTAMIYLSCHIHLPRHAISSQFHPSCPCHLLPIKSMPESSDYTEILPIEPFIVLEVSGPGHLRSSVQPIIHEQLCEGPVHMTVVQFSPAAVKQQRIAMYHACSDASRYCNCGFPIPLCRLSSKSRLRMRGAYTLERLKKAHRAI